jgi:hypothetical protein
MGQTSAAQPDRLLLSIAEQLRQPLTVIARQAELAQLTGDVSLVNNHGIRTQATAALSLLDSYLLGLDLLRDQSQLQLQPVSLSSLLADTWHELDAFAKYYRVELELVTGGKYGPVMGHPGGLKAAMLSLGFALVEAQAEWAERRHKVVVLAVHRTPHGIVAGVYGQQPAVNANSWRTALELCGRASQPFVGLPGAGAAGLFVADAILRSMNSHLRVGRYQRQGGLAATLQPSQQLQFI